jgi:hypothetical protein
MYMHRCGFIKHRKKVLATLTWPPLWIQQFLGIRQPFPCLRLAFYLIIHCTGHFELAKTAPVSELTDHVVGVLLLETSTSKQVGVLHLEFFYLALHFVMSGTGREEERHPSLALPSGSVEPTARSWEKFSHWVCCMCVVTFDLELGQAIEVRIHGQK